ncbi:MAG: hypothetical protein AAGH65_10710, partial [Pseudomonadota bacterium]
VDGSFQSALTGPQINSMIEGLAFDGNLIWAIADDNLLGLSPSDGSVQETLSNPAASCSFQGTALAFDGTSLVVGCPSGDWFIVNPASGSVIDSGNNSLNMFGLAGAIAQALPETQSVPTLSVWGIFILCLLLSIFALSSINSSKRHN